MRKQHCPVHLWRSLTLQLTASVAKLGIKDSSRNVERHVSELNICQGLVLQSSNVEKQSFCLSLEFLAVTTVLKMHKHGRETLGRCVNSIDDWK